ncbi:MULTISPECIES: hypothetical protein [Actinomyces]|uniref:hypothetical protein n=1 Tax=Actinomyces TaxID=1654 RepID=UPI0011614E49|nr:MULTISPECIES: hypothetical protein [Actinomyces]
MTLRTDENRPVTAHVNGRPLLRLDLSYQLELTNDGKYLRTTRSSFQVRGMVPRREPFFRYDFLASPRSKTVPTAHLQVYGHRDDLLHAMYISNRAKSKPSRRKDLDPSSPRGVGMIHFPVGGTRFRPCLEDILELIINEFGVDTVDGWQEALTTGRIAWRHLQLASAVRDDPETARNALNELDRGRSTNEEGLGRY